MSIRAFVPPLAAACVVAAVACQETATPTDPAPSSDKALGAPQAPEPGQLQHWHDRALELFDMAGVVFTDIDERHGRLVVAVEDLALAGAVERRLVRLGVPLRAVMIRQTAPIVLAATLQQHVRPLQGGLQIAFSEGICSLGFHAILDDVQGFLVASHCTEEYGELDDTEHHQPSEEGDLNLIGQETVDPPFSRSRCPGVINVNECRHSDAAFDQLAGNVDDDVDVDFGHISRTENVNSGSLQIDGTFRITNRARGNATLGETLGKVGRTTGWTEGQVTNTCINVRVVGRNVKGSKALLCQDMVEAGVGAGDSGSPVFRVTNDPEDEDVTLHGILWGATTDGTSFVYSPVDNVHKDFEETLSVCAEGFGC